ncbi:RNA polymerase II C-terminal domain phosphatase-like 4 [Citrus sinensis]|nr:RNA polymerase II C-terminal domain phosphatase-like 4 [Citrus sinensis]
MSVATDSPVHSPSSDDFAALLDAELDSNSLRLSPDKEADDEDDDKETKRHKRQIVEIILEHQGSTSLGIFEEKTEVSLEMDNCLHPGSLGGMCCGKRLEEECGVTFSYAYKGLRVGNDKIDRLRNTDMKHLLRHRKLYLILELDHTLLNWTLLLHLTPEEDYLKSQVESLQDVSKGSLFMLAFMNIMTKLRPVVHTFFIEANDGTQRHQKGLDVVLGQESAVLILDDTENGDNLILMERYHFFASSCRQFGYHCQSLSQLRSVVCELEGALASILKDLKRIHNMFFKELANDLAGRDVRQREVLKGCKLVFSHAFPSKFPAHIHYLWKVVEQLGATCSIELDPSVTHSHWAAKEAKFLVDPRWIEAANCLWQGQLEEKFPVKQTKPEENFQAKQTKDQ